MASLLRLGLRNGSRIISSNLAKQNRLHQPACLISTSKKNKDSVTVTESAESVPESTENLAEKEENWISFGYDLVDKDEDKWNAHSNLFFTVTLGLVLTGFALVYFPDMKMSEWTQREAYLELAKREAAGLPLVDPNLINPAKIELPSDEELQNTEIII